MRDFPRQSMADVFLSYASEDHEQAARLANALQAHGWSLWWDRHISVGQAFDDAIERALEEARSVVVLWSKSSAASEWVRSEAAAAAERGILCPARLDAVKLPLEFRRRQTIDLSNWNGDEAHPGFVALCSRIGVLTGRPVPEPASITPQPRPARASHADRRRWAVAPLVLLCILAAGAVWWWLDRLSPEELGKALVVAAARADAAAVRSLIADGADLRQAGPPALRAAVNLIGTSDLDISPESQARIIQALLEAGVDPNTRFEDGITALMFLASSRQELLPSIQVLLEQRADIHLKCECTFCRDGSHGCNALMMAATEGHFGAIKLLLDKGARLNDRTNDGTTALMMAREPDVVRLLLKQGADPNLRDKKGATALLTAVDAAIEEDGILALIEAGADVRAADEAGRTALALAAERGWDSVLRLLLDKGADIDAATAKGMTPLMLAAVRGRADSVRLLLEHGAVLNKQNLGGKTALQLAQERLEGDVRDEIVHALKTADARKPRATTRQEGR